MPTTKVEVDGRVDEDAPRRRLAERIEVRRHWIEARLLARLRVDAAQLAGVEHTVVADHEHEVARPVALGNRRFEARPTPEPRLITIGRARGEELRHKWPEAIRHDGEGPDGGDTPGNEVADVDIPEVLQRDLVAQPGHGRIVQRRPVLDDERPPDAAGARVSASRGR